MDCCYHIFQCIFSTTSSSDGGVSTTTTTCSCSCCFEYLRLKPSSKPTLNKNKETRKNIKQDLPTSIILGSIYNNNTNTCNQNSNHALPSHSFPKIK